MFCICLHWSIDSDVPSTFQVFCFYFILFIVTTYKLGSLHKLAPQCDPAPIPAPQPWRPICLRYPCFLPCAEPSRARAQVRASGITVVFWSRLSQLSIQHNQVRHTSSLLCHHIINRRVDADINVIWDLDALRSESDAKQMQYVSHMRRNCCHDLHGKFSSATAGK